MIPGERRSERARKSNSASNLVSVLQQLGSFHHTPEPLNHLYYSFGIFRFIKSFPFLYSYSFRIFFTESSVM